MEVHNVSSTFNKDWYSDKAKIIKQDENFMIIDYGCQGKGIVTSYTLFDGIQLSFLDFDTDISMPSQKFNPILFQLHIVALDAMNVSMPIIQFRIYQRDILV